MPSVFIFLSNTIDLGLAFNSLAQYVYNSYNNPANTFCEYTVPLIALEFSISENVKFEKVIGLNTEEGLKIGSVVVTGLSGTSNPF